MKTTSGTIIRATAGHFLLYHAPHRSFYCGPDALMMHPFYWNSGKLEMLITRAEFNTLSAADILTIATMSANLLRLGLNPEETRDNLFSFQAQRGLGTEAIQNSLVYTRDHEFFFFSDGRLFDWQFGQDKKNGVQLEADSEENRLKIYTLLADIQGLGLSIRKDPDNHEEVCTFS